MLGASWQRCRAHWVRNALAHAPKGQHVMVAAAIRQAFLPPDADAARPTWHQGSAVLAAVKTTPPAAVALPVVGPVLTAAVRRGFADARSAPRNGPSVSPKNIHKVRTPLPSPEHTMNERTHNVLQKPDIFRSYRQPFQRELLSRGGTGDRAAKSRDRRCNLGHAAFSVVPRLRRPCAASRCRAAIG
jgi:mutator family transposase